MSKGLEALDRLFDLIIDEYSGCECLKDYEQDYKIIETELKRLEELEKAYDLVVDGLYNASEKQEKQDEILRIIKEHIAFRGGYIYLKGIPQSGELYNKLKEWLK